MAMIAAALSAPLSAYALNLLMQATTYAIAVLGLTIVLGYAGQINLAQAAFFGLGAYSVALGTTAFALPFGLALAIGVVVAAVAGAVLGLTSLRAMQAVRDNELAANVVGVPQERRGACSRPEAHARPSQWRDWCRRQVGSRR
jgi:ABC-type branched-subunit amino acid transport system permease subunit